MEPPSLMLRYYLLHIIRILFKLNKQLLSHAESPLNYPFNSTNNPPPPIVPFVSTMEKLSERGEHAVVEFKYGMLHTHKARPNIVHLTLRFSTFYNNFSPFFFSSEVENVLWAA